MSSVVKEAVLHGPVIACVEWWINGGRYDDLNTAWGERLELHRDGAVYGRKVMWHRDQGFAQLRRRKAMNLDRALRERGSWQDFRDEWVAMQVNLGRRVVDLAELKKGTGT